MDDNTVIESTLEKSGAPQPFIRKGWERALFFVIALPVYLLFQPLVVSVVSNFGTLPTGEYIHSFETPIMILAESASLVYTLIYIWLFRRFIDRRSLAALGMSFGRRYRRDFVMGLVWGGGMAAAVFVLLWMFGLAQIQRIQFPIMSILVMAATLLLAAAQEELLMRGYLLNNLMQSVNKYLSLLIVSILFSIGHVLNPNFTLIGLLNIILAGLYLGIYYIYRQNLWFPIGIHFAWNWFQGGVFGSPVSGFQMQSIIVVQFSGNEGLSGGGFGFEGSLIMTVVAALTVILLHFIYRQPRNGPESATPESPPTEQK